MKQEFLEAGQIVNTHGVRGEVKIAPWTDSADFLRAIPTLYLGGVPYQVESARVHKDMLIAKLSGVDTVEAAEALRNKVLSFRRADAALPEGTFFLADIIGLPVIDEAGAPLGKLIEVLTATAQRVYVVRGEREIMIPAVPAFILETNVDGGYIKVRLIEGM